jgi:hypothetical protein
MSGVGLRRRTTGAVMDETELAMKKATWCKHHEASTFFSYIDKNGL